MASGTRLSLFLPNGQFQMGTLLLLHVGFGMLMGYGARLIWWMRTGEAFFTGRPYPLLFGAYHLLTAMAMHLLVLRGAIGNARRRMYVIAGAAACMLLFIMLRWIGDQWLMPVIGHQANYPPQTGFVSFALDNILYALLPIGFATLVHLAEQQLMQHQQRTELAYRERLSELDMLRARVAPHFLYNTLNNLYALSQRSGTDLGPPLMDLADLMRYIAKHQNEFVAIGTELEQVDRFIALQALRHQHPLNIRIEVDDDLRRLRVPSMVLLPLMENAFKHGDPCDRTIPMDLRISSANGRIHIACTNKVGTLAGDGSIPTGNHNLQRRVELHFGDQAVVSFCNTKDHRFVAELSFPAST